jgi:hypothetical protein
LPGMKRPDRCDGLSAGGGGWGSAVGMHIMQGVRASGAVTCGHGVHRGNVMCACNIWRWLVETRRCCEVDCTTDRDKIMFVYFPCVVDSNFKINFDVRYCLLGLRMTD